MMLALAAATPLWGQGLSLTARSEEQVAGQIASQVEFSSRLETLDFAVVSLVIHDSTEIRAEIDYGREEVTVKGFSRTTGRPAGLSESDLAAVADLAKSLTWSRTRRVEDALVSTLNLLQVYAAGDRIDVSTVGKKKPAYTSLCSQTGGTVTGTYTVGQSTFSETAQLGPCYSEPNQCLGRCGAGCGGAPGAAIQRFTQECFNHDLCTRKTGHILFDCADEFNAATNGFFFAPDCGTLQGSWQDNYGFLWTLQQSSKVRGQVKTVDCLTWAVTGTHIGANISLQAKNPRELANCCKSFSYTGKASDCNTASGNWVNACGGAGQWSLARHGKEERFSFTTGEGDAATPTDPNPK